MTGQRHSDNSKYNLKVTVIELDAEPEEVQSSLVLNTVVVLSVVATAMLRYTYYYRTTTKYPLMHL